MRCKKLMCSCRSKYHRKHLSIETERQTDPGREDSEDSAARKSGSLFNPIDTARYPACVARVSVFSTSSPGPDGREDGILWRWEPSSSVFCNLSSSLLSVLNFVELHFCWLNENDRRRMPKWFVLDIFEHTSADLRKGLHQEYSQFSWFNRKSFFGHGQISENRKGHRFSLGGGFIYFCRDAPIWRAYVSDGLVQPPATWRIILISKWLGSPPFIKHIGHFEGVPRCPILRGQN